MSDDEAALIEVAKAIGRHVAEQEYRRLRMTENPKRCAWFLRCDNPATTTRPHPVLGDVPICQRCNDKITRLEAR